VNEVDVRTQTNGAAYRRKPVLRRLYADIYRQITAELAPGPTVEIGGGSGIFKEFAPAVIATDIMPAPWLDLVADAQTLPFASGSIGNLVAFDVLHHIEFPVRFFREAERVLAPGGRIILVEPGITPISGVFLRLFHEEPVRMKADPWHDGAPDPGRDPFTSNQAIPTLMLARQRERFHQEFPGLTISQTRWMSLAAYPLSGGFQDWCLLPQAALTPLLTLERWLLPVFGRLAAFRLFAVIERRPSSGGR